LLESAPDAMVIVEKDGTIVLVNSQAEKIFGYARSELLGQKMEILLPDRYRGSHVGQRTGYFTNPRVRPMGAGLELFARRKNGEEFPVEICLSPLKTQQGLLVTSAIRDVTERKKIEKELKEAREAADAANKSKSAFLANMSHEIRTPLAGILGYAEMLKHYCKTDEERTDYIYKIKKNADNLTELINDILDLSKVEAGALNVERIKIHLMNEVESILSLLQDQAREKGLAIETIFEQPLPKYLVSDPKRIRQILINIVGNAVKFTEKGKITIRVFQKKEKEKVRLYFSVKDTGCGLPSEAQSRLFQPFVQADSSTTRKYGGTGLGLALSRRLAKALGGELELTESVFQVGSTFTFSLDPGYVEDLSMQNEAEKKNALGDIKSIRLEGVRVLLAEDNESNEELVTKFLRHAGATIEVAKNGSEAISLALAEDFDIVFMDLQMPVMDGYTATEKLRQKGFKKPIVALTAHAMIEEREKCFAVGFTDFLTKPINISRLLKTVAKLTHRNLPAGG